MIEIYHNPRCSKSREGLEILKNSNQEYTINNYLKYPPTIAELNELIQLLDISPIQLIRTGESVWKENFKGKELSDNQIIKAMSTYPKLIERPIVINGNKGIVGRPPALIKDII
jgi:arsenate reductase